MWCSYGWVYHARSKETGRRYAIKQFKAGRVSELYAYMRCVLGTHAGVNACCVHVQDMHSVARAACMQEGDGVSVTAIREIMLLRELKHENVVGLEVRSVCTLTGHGHAERCIYGSPGPAAGALNHSSRHERHGNTCTVSATKSRCSSLATHCKSPLRAATAPNSAPVLAAADESLIVRGS